MHIWLLLNSNTTHSSLNLLTFLRSCWGALGALLAKESSSRQLGWRMSISVGIPNGSSSGWIHGSMDWPSLPSIPCKFDLFSRPSTLHHPPTDMFHYIWGKRSIWLWNNRWWLYNHFLYLYHQVREGVESYSHLE